METAKKIKVEETTLGFCVAKFALVKYDNGDIPFTQCLNLNYNDIIGWYYPVFFSTTEKIEIGDKVLFNNKVADVTETFYKMCKTFIEKRNSCYKILAMPENISPKTLQEIKNLTFKIDDYVLIECETYLGEQRFSKHISDTTTDKEYGIIKLNENNHITVKPVEKYTWDDVYKEFLVTCEHKIKSSGELAFINFLKKNNYIIKQKK